MVKSLLSDHDVVVVPLHVGVSVSYLHRMLRWGRSTRGHARGMSDHLRGATFLKYGRESTGVRHQLHVSLFSSHAFSFSGLQAIKGFRQIRGLKFWVTLRLVAPLAPLSPPLLLLLRRLPEGMRDGAGVLVTRRRRGRF